MKKMTRESLEWMTVGRPQMFDTRFGVLTFVERVDSKNWKVRTNGQALVQSLELTLLMCMSAVDGGIGELSLSDGEYQIYSREEGTMTIKVILKNGEYLHYLTLPLPDTFERNAKKIIALDREGTLRPNLA